MSKDLRKSPFLAKYSAWFPKSEDEVAQALKHGIVAVDTNVLLDLYKFEEKATQEWLQALQKLEDRLFIPAQVADEFWRNREKSVANPEDVIAAEREIEKSKDAIRRAFVGWLDKRNASLTDAQEEHLQQLDEVVQPLLDFLDSAKESHASRFSIRPEEDQVTKGIAELTKEPKRARLGDPYSPRILEEKIAEGARRYEEKIPPGFMDDGSNSEAKNKKSGVTKFGDWFVWDQFLSAANEFKPKDKETGRFAVLVTGDLKKDWWHRSPSDGESETKRIALPQLAEEMSARASCKYVQLTPEEFLTAVRSALGADISDTTVEATNAANKRNWYSDEFSLASTKKQYSATARISSEGDCRVLKGSSARLEEVASLSSTYTNLRATLIDKGILALSEDGSRYIFTEDYMFNSPSAASAAITASSMSGKKHWKNAAGLSLNDLEEAQGSAIADDDTEDER